MRGKPIALDEPMVHGETGMDRFCEYMIRAHDHLATHLPGWMCAGDESGVWRAVHPTTGERIVGRSPIELVAKVNEVLAKANVCQISTLKA